MPRYDYLCPKCNFTLELDRKLSQRDAEKLCEQTGHKFADGTCTTCGFLQSEALCPKCKSVLKFVLGTPNINPVTTGEWRKGLSGDPAVARRKKFKN